MIAYNLYIGKDFLKQVVHQTDSEPCSQIEVAWCPPRTFKAADEGFLPTETDIAYYKMIFKYTGYNHNTGCFNYSLYEFGDCK